LLGISATLRAALPVPEFELDSSEAKELAKAYTDVAQFYPSLRLGDHVTAMINLGSVVSIIVGSRIVSYKMRSASNRATARKDAGKPVTDIDMRGVLNNTPPAPSNGRAPVAPREVAEDVRTGEIPGVGNVVFPPDHPLMGGKKH
jgi:hypothetical protein